MKISLQYFFPLWILFFLVGKPGFGQCPTLTAIMIDACGTENLNEFVIINSGGGFNTSNLQFSFDSNNNNGGPENNDIHIDLSNYPVDPTPCSLQPGNPALISGCSNVIPVGLNYDIPPNATVVLQTSGGANTPYDFSAICGSGGCIYVIQNSCTRSIGGFTNLATGSPGPRTNVLALSNEPSCFFSYVYNTTLLSGANGDYFIPPATFGNAGCVSPPVASIPPGPTFNNPGNQTACGSYTLPPVTGNNLSGNEAYFTAPNGGGTQFLPGQNVTSTSTLYIFDPTSGCSPVPNPSFTITITPAPTANATNLSACNNGAGQGTFDLTTVNNIVNGGTGFTVNWYTNSAATIPIGDPTNYTAGPGNVYATISDGSCTSDNVAQITLTLTPAPTAVPASASACDNGAGSGTFNLNLLLGTINGGTGNPVTFYTDMAATNVIPAPGAYTSGPGTIYATVSNGTCQSQSVPITLSIAPTLNTGNTFITVNPSNGCGDTQVSVQFFFPVGGDYEVELDYGSVANGYQTYTAIISNMGIAQLDISQTSEFILLSVTDENGCTSTFSPPNVEVVTISPPPDLATTDAPSVCEGEGYNLAAINITDNNNTNLPVTFHSGNPPTAGNLLPGTIVFPTSTTTYYAFADGGPGCQDVLPVTIVVTPAPIAGSFTLQECNEGGNQATFNLSANNNIVNGGTGNAVSWYSDPGITVPIPNPGGYLTGSTTVYATVFDGACVSTPASIVLEVLPGPVANAPNQSLQICYTLFPPSVTENISEVESEINGGTGQTVNWYVDAAATNPIDPSDWQDLLANGWDPIYATVTDGNCESATVPVNVALSPVPTANPASSSLCSSSGGNATFDLLQLTGTITGGAPNTVEFFTDAAVTMPINNPGAFSSGSATVYAVVSTPEGCTSNPAPVTLTVTPSPTANPATLEECATVGNQAIFNLTGADGVVTGGGGGVVNWYSDPGATSLISNPANFLSGATTVYAVVNANGCNSSPAPVSLVISAGPPAFSASMSECESANNQATFDLTGLNQTVNGNSGSTVSWYLDPAGSTPILNPATFQSPTGIVYATVTSGGCESAPVPVALDVTPTPAANSTSLSKCDEGGGQVTFDLTTADQTVNGGNANAVSWFLNADQTGQIANPGAFSSGPATVYAVVSSGGCNSAPVPVLLEILPTPQANPASLNACNNGSGQAEFNLTSLESAINGNSGNQVNWYANFSGTISISNPDNYTAPTGTVFASVTDGVCESPFVSVSLLVAANPSVTPSQSQTILCNGATTGGIGLAVSGGAFPYSFDWNNDALDGIQNPTGIGAGLYEVIVTDNNDCETTVSIELNEPDALILNCVQLNPVSADGASDGAATITFGGGTAGYELDWTGPVFGNQTESDAGEFDITDLPEGVYNIVFTDANNCETTCSVVINGPSCIMSLDFAVSDPSCPGATDGAISLTINDGAAPFDIDWSEDDFDGEENLSGLAAGAFSVTVTDSEDCQAVASVTLADPAELVLNCSENSPVSVVGGDDGSAAIIFSGGSAPYAFAWAGPVSGSTTADDPGSLIIPDLQAGNYGLTLTDDNGCETICVFTITDPNCMMTLAISGQDAVCSGSETGSILLLINNGASPFVIDWNDDELDDLTNPMDVPAGNYVVIVTDADGCEATASITIGQPPAIQLVCSQLTPVTVTGGSDGKAQLEIFGGIQPYTINWTGPVSGSQTMPTFGIATISDLSAGVYNITVLDSIGCSTTCTVTINSLGCNLLMDIAVENVSCPGADDGAIHIDVFNATEPIDYDWLDNTLDGLSNPTGLQPGTYIVLVTDEPGCMLGALIMVNEPDTLKITCSEISPTQTVGGNEGKGGVTITGGTKPFTITWTGAADGSLTTNNSGTITIPDLLEGDYDIIVTDANGCEASCSFSIAGPLCDWMVAASVQDASCAGESDGGISLTIDDAMAPLVIDWNDDGFDGQEILLNLAAGTYSVTVTDAALCMDSLTVVVGEPAAVDLACVVIADASAPGVDDGQAEITFDGGDSPYLLEWSGPSGGAQNEPLPGAVILGNLAAGNYEVIVTDGNNCKATCTFTISDGQCNLTLELTALDATCPGDSNGAIDLTVTGGAAPLLFDWSDDNFDGIEDPAGLPAGDYTVKVTDDNGCVETASVTVGTANAEPDALLVTPAFLCTDDCINFDINLTGNAPFAVEYSITTFSGDSSQGLNTNNADNNIAICLSDIGLTGDTVVITLISVQDATCSANLGQTEVTFIESVQVLIGQTLCSGESIIVNGTVYDENNPTGTEIIPASGPNACDSIIVVELRFFDPATSSVNTQLCQGQSIVVNGNTYDESNPSGTEILLGQGQNGCDSTVVISLSFSDVIETTLNPVLCPGENITVNGNVYDENNPAGQEILLSSGGCDSIVIIDLFFPAPAFFNLEQTLCAGESVTVNGSQYDEDNPAGTEIILGASVNGCDSTVQINLSFLQHASFDLVQTLCEGESVAVNGTVYDQNNPSGMETLVGAAANGCDSIVSIGLSFVAPVSEDIELELCSGENLTVNGTVYDESNPIGTEVIVGGSTQGCDSTINVSLSFFAPAVFDLSRTLCEGEGIIVNGTPYDESNPTGTEILAGASADGCDSTVHISLNFIPASFTLLETTLCSGENIEVNGTIYDENNPSGTEIIAGGSVAGCDSTVQVSLTFLPALVGSISGDAAICPGETATLIFNLSGAATFDVQYSDGVNPPITLSGIVDGFTVEVSPTANTTYNIVQLTTAGSACSVDIGEGATVLVSDINLTASVSSDFGGFGVSCAGSSDGSAIVIAAGGIPPYSYEWSGGGSTAEISGLFAGTYEVAVEDSAGCRAEASVTLTEPEAIAVKASAQSPACFGDEDGLIIIDEILGGATPIEYSLDGEFFQVISGAPFVIGNLSAGLYNLQLQDDNDCTTEISLTVPAPLELLLDLGDDRTIRLGDSLLLNPIVNFDVAQFQWSPADFLSDPGSLSGFTRPTESVLYRLTATDSSGCTISDQIRITINRERNVLVPNVFSPNDDGVNDVLTVFGGADVLEVKIFRIFDRWGNLVYEAGPFQPNDLTFGWDGKFNGQVMNPAVFVYFADVEFVDGQVIRFSGDVTLVR